MIASKEEEILEALRSVIDPEIGLNVVELGLIRNLEIDEDQTKITMILTTPFCPYGPWLVQQVKETAEKAAGRDVKVQVLPEQWTPEMMEDPTLLGFF